MTAIGAVVLPIILAVLGVIVSIRPIAPGKWQKATIAAFIFLGGIAALLAAIDRLNSDKAQAELKRAIEGLRDSIDQLTKPVPQPIKPARDPDAVYQNENAVGRVIGARITLNESKVYFEQIQNAGNLDTNKNFEFRDYVLHFIRADRYVGMLVQMPGGVATNVYQHVVCEIVGRIN